jgi:hypothetical protein
MSRSSGRSAQTAGSAGQKSAAVAGAAVAGAAVAGAAGAGAAGASGTGGSSAGSRSGGKVVEGMFLAPGSGECKVTANALGGRIRTRLQLDFVVPQASDISAGLLVSGLVT